MSREGPGEEAADCRRAGRRDRPVDYHDGRENDDDSGSPSYRRVRDRRRPGGDVAHCGPTDATVAHSVDAPNNTREHAGCAIAAAGTGGERGYCNRADIIART